MPPDTHTCVWWHYTYFFIRLRFSWTAVCCFFSFSISSNKWVNCGLTCCSSLTPTHNKNEIILKYWLLLTYQDVLMNTFTKGTYIDFLLPHVLAYILLYIKYIKFSCGKTFPFDWNSYTIKLLKWKTISQCNSLTVYDTGTAVHLYCSMAAWTSCGP